MKRSELNSIIEDTIKFMEDRGLPLPPFAYWGVPEWKAAGKENEEIVENMLGWDITDFGSGDFEKIGLTIFTFRNGNFYKKDKYPKPYAEKLLLVGDGQVLPYHYHWSKMEDIINRGGGNLAITLYNCTEEDFKDVEGGRAGKSGTFADTPVTVSVDGCNVTVPAGGQIILKPGQSVTIHGRGFREQERLCCLKYQPVTMTRLTIVSIPQVEEFRKLKKMKKQNI